MWRPERNRNNFGNILLMVEVAAIAIIISSIGAYLWTQVGISYLDKFLQLAFAGGIIFAIALSANYVLSKRW